MALVVSLVISGCVSGVISAMLFCIILVGATNLRRRVPLTFFCRIRYTQNHHEYIREPRYSRIALGTSKPQPSCIDASHSDRYQVSAVFQYPDRLCNPGFPASTNCQEPRIANCRLSEGDMDRHEYWPRHTCAVHYDGGITTGQECR